MYVLLIEDRAHVDIQGAVDHYDSVQPGLGKKFIIALEKELASISSSPFYRVRYRNVRCKLIKKFPYLIHYSLHTKKKQVFVFAIICTHRGPSKSKVRKK